jgi:Mg2+/Co2+ transporter CorB
MTAVTLAILLVVISVLIFCSALFSGVETALFSLKSHQLRRLETNHVSLTKFVSFSGKIRVASEYFLGDGVTNLARFAMPLFLVGGSTG